MLIIIWLSAYNEISENWKSITILVISENLSPMYRIVSEKFFLKNPQIYKKCLSSLAFCLPAISQCLIAPVFSVIDCKELKLSQTAQINQLFQFVCTATSSMGKLLC